MLGEERDMIKKWCPMVRITKTIGDAYINNRGELIDEDEMTPAQFACIGSKCGAWDIISNTTGCGECGLKKER